MLDFRLLGISCSAEELNCSDDNGRAGLIVVTTQMSTKKLSKAIKAFKIKNLAMCEVPLILGKVQWKY